MLSLLVLLFSGCASQSAQPEAADFKARFEKELRWILKQKPKYVWGGTSDVTGIDCSGYLWLAAKRSGLPVFRTTAKNMACARDGWTFLGKHLGVRDAEELDFVWWTFIKSRPFGHIGVLLRDQNTLFPGVTHASSKRGVVLDPLQGTLLRDIAQIKRKQWQ